MPRMSPVTQTQQQPPSKISPDTAHLIFRPYMIRAGVALAFGIFSLIYQAPDLMDSGPAWVNVSCAIYLFLTGVAMWEFLRQEPVPEAMRSPLSMAAAAWVLGPVALVGAQLFSAGVMATAIILSLALLVAGIAQLVAGGGYRKEFPPARDWLIPGAVDVLTAVATVIAIFVGADFHNLLGIVGSAAFIHAVFCSIPGVGYYLDTRRARRRGWRPKES